MHHYDKKADSSSVMIPLPYFQQWLLALKPPTHPTWRLLSPLFTNLELVKSFLLLHLHLFKYVPFFLYCLRWYIHLSFKLMKYPYSFCHLIFLSYCFSIHFQQFFFNITFITSFVTYFDGSLWTVRVVYDLISIYLFILILLVPLLMPSVYSYPLLAVPFLFVHILLSFPSNDFKFSLLLKLFYSPLSCCSFVKT